MQYIVSALLKHGFEVQQHPQFISELQGTSTYKGQRKCDIVIYNHSTLPEVCKGDVVRAGAYWFMKPTGPTQAHFTLDVLGYGPYSSISLTKPPFELADVFDVATFFDTTVSKWIADNTNKFGKTYELVPVAEDNFYLLIGQTLRDYTTRSMYFGSYIEALVSAAEYLVSVDKLPIVVKLHPRVEEEHRVKMLQRFRAISPRISVYSGSQSIHSFLPKCRAVLLCNSTAGFEAMMHKKPIISFGHPEYHWIGYDLRYLCDLDRAISLSWFNEQASCKYLYWYMTRYCCCDQQSTTTRVKELLNVPTTK